MSNDQKTAGRKKHTGWIVVGIIVIAFAVWWVAAAPPDYIKVSPKYVMGKIPQSIVKVTDKNDILATRMTIEVPELPGHDDLIFQKEKGRAFATGMDGWIWKIDLKTMKAEKFVDAPLMASGAVQDPNDINTLYFCASYLYGETYPENEKVGIYKLNLETRQITTVADRVPNVPKTFAVPQGNRGMVYAKGEVSLKQSAMNDQNSRPAKFCNDLAISRDGRRIYWSEPFAYRGASMGGGAVAEAISLGENGLLWRLDMETGVVSLIGQGYSFVDGVLLEYDGDSKVESSVLITETIKFDILRFYLTGDKAGRDEVVLKDLPGMPDGLDRAQNGNILIGLLKKRTALANKLFAHPWLRQFVLRLPQRVLAGGGNQTGIMILSKDGATPLYCTMHDGSKMSDISVLVAHDDRLYMPRFTRYMYGLYSIGDPLGKSKVGTPSVKSP